MYIDQKGKRHRVCPDRAFRKIGCGDPDDPSYLPYLIPEGQNYPNYMFHYSPAQLFSNRNSDPTPVYQARYSLTWRNELERVRWWETINIF